MSVFEFKDLKTWFYTDDGIVKAVNGVSFEIPEGKTVCVVGESGCGKSVTALSMMHLVQTPPGRIVGGQILMDGVDLLKLSDREMQQINGKQIGMIFQEPMTSLNPVFTAGEQISEVMLLHEPRELAAAAIQRMDAVENALAEGKRAKMAMNEKGELSCSECGTEVDGRGELCPGCGSYLGRKSAGQVRFKNSFGRRSMRKVINDPESFGLYLSGKLPVLRRYKKLLEWEAMERAIDVLKLVKVPDPVNVATSYPYELSGGMQQRVMIAMALVCRPQLLIADEPTTALDVTIQAQILELINDLKQKTGASVIMITHDLGVISRVADEVLVMYAGKAMEYGSARDVFTQPRHPYTAALLKSIPNLEDDVERLHVIEGMVPSLSKRPEGCLFNPRCKHVMPVCREKRPALTTGPDGRRVRCFLQSDAIEKEEAHA